MSEHIHADLIQAWAEGASIEFKSLYDGKWKPCANPSWNKKTAYRISLKQDSYNINRIPNTDK